MVNFADLQIWGSWLGVLSKGNGEEPFHFHWTAWTWTEGSYKLYRQLSHKILGLWQENYLFHIIEPSSRRWSTTLRRMIVSELKTSIKLTRISKCCKRIWGTQKKRSFIQSRKLSQVYLRTQANVVNLWGIIARRISSTSTTTLSTSSSTWTSSPSNIIISTKDSSTPHPKHQQQWNHQCKGRSARDKWKDEQEDFGLREKPRDVQVLNCSYFFLKMKH